MHKLSPEFLCFLSLARYLGEGRVSLSHEKGSTFKHFYQLCRAVWARWCFHARSKLCASEKSCGSYSEGSGFHNVGAHKGPHLCVEEKQLFMVWYSSLSLGKLAPGVQALWYFLSFNMEMGFYWKMSCVLKMGELHPPLQARDSLTWAHNNPERGKGSMVPSIHGLHVAKHLTTVFGDPYVQIIYIQCVLQRWKDGANWCSWVWNDTDFRHIGRSHGVIIQWIF